LAGRGKRRGREQGTFEKSGRRFSGEGGEPFGSLPRNGGGRKEGVSTGENLSSKSSKKNRGGGNRKKLQKNLKKATPHVLGGKSGQNLDQGLKNMKVWKEKAKLKGDAWKTPKPPQGRNEAYRKKRRGESS